MKQKLALVLAMLLMFSVVFVPVNYAAWADQQSITETFEGYPVSEGAFVAMDIVTGNKWKQLHAGKYANAYLTKENGNTVAVIKDFDQKASAILDFFLTKTVVENSVTKNIYNMADGGLDQLFRELMMRFQFFGDASSVVMKKGKSYIMSYDYKYTSGNTNLNIDNRAGFIFPKHLVPSFTGANFGSWPAVTALKKTDTQQIYGAGRDSVAKGNGWYNGGGTITFDKILEKNDKFVYADASTHVELQETPLTFMSFEFRGLANFASKNGIDSIFTMLTQSLADYMVELKANPTSTNLPSLKATALTNFTQRLAAADFRVYLDNVSFEEDSEDGEDFEGTLSLEQNQTYYTSERAEAPLQVKAYQSDGTSDDLTGTDGVTYTSSDPSVFQFTEGNKLKSTGKVGMSTITATYKGVSASVLMVRATETPAAKAEADLPNKYKVAAGGLTGHDGGQAYMHSTSISNAGDWALRAYVGRASKWFEQGYRSMSGWFYDDMSPTTRAAIYTNVLDSQSYNENFVDSYSYGNFDWTGKNYYTASWTAGLVNAGASHYHYMSGSTQMNLAPRSKGWHQVSAMLIQDPTSTWGWSVVYYLDGKEVLKKAVEPDSSGTSESCLELRAIHYGSDAYYDDFFMTGKLDSFNPDYQPVETEKIIYQQKFDGSLGNWEFNKGTGALVSSGGIDNSGAYKATNCEAGSQFVYRKNITMTSGNRYRISAWTKSATNVNVLLGIEFTPNVVTFVPSPYKRTPSQTTWHQISNEVAITSIKDENGNDLAQTTPGTLFIRFEGDTTEAWLDSVEIIEISENKPPVVQSVNIKGTPMVGSVLTAEAVINDPDGDLLDTALYQWQSSTNGTDWSDITGATNQSYTCVEQDVEKFIRVQVTPKSKQAPTTGDMVSSEATNKIMEATTPPSASGVSVSGTPEIGSSLTALYTYQKSADGAEEGATEFLWEIADSQAGPYRALSEKSKQYTISYADGGKYIRVTVIPKDQNGVAGTPVVSSPISIQKVIEYVLYVAKNGNDTNGGTIDKPFATLERAKQEVREIAKTGLNKPVTVYIRAGEYHLNQGISFDQQDSGTALCPISYKAYPGEKVRFTGAKILESSSVKKVTDSTILNRVLDPVAKQKIRQIDLGAQGITSIPEISDYGFGVSNNYSPVEIYFDGVALAQSRWPNEDFTYITSAKVNGSNFKTDPFTLGYKDDENHTAKWNTSVLKDLYVSGFIGNDWAGVTHKLASIDPVNKTVTSVGGTSYTPSSNHKIYFFNLIEEIDMPGESYIDRDKNIVYFYPYHENFSDVEIAVAELNQPLLTLNGTSHVFFEDLYLDTTRNNAINATNVSNITIDGCEIGHTAANAITLKGTNCLIQNNHIYDLGRGGIFISGGDRTTLTSSNNVIRNNRMHKGERVYNSYVPVIDVSQCVGLTIENNQLYDSKHQLVRFATSNDILFQYNEVHNAVNQAADMSALYFGRNPSVLGIEINYNYFHDIGNSYGGYGQQAIFWDDGAYGPQVYGNIFYRATRTADQGGTIANHCYPLKTFGGQFSQIKNNVIVDAPTAFRFSVWADWFEWVYDKSESKNHNIWSLMRAANFDSPIWKERYKDTQWQYVHQYFTQEKKDEIAPLTGDALKNFITKNKPPAVTNVFEGNVLAKVNQVIQGGSVQESGTYQIPDAQTEASFVDYGKDFKLTPSALSQVQKTIPDFENLPTEKIGLKPASKNGATLLVGGSAPSASNAKVISDVNALRFNYSFADPDGDKEGVSDISWWISEKENGIYTKIEGEKDKLLGLETSYQGKYVKCQVKPIDIRMIEGETIETAPIQVVDGGSGALDFIDLLYAMDEIKALLSEAVVGEEDGNYPQDAVDTLKAVLTEAEGVISTAQYQYQIDNLVKKLTTDIAIFKNFRIQRMEYTSIRGMINEGVDSWVRYNGSGELKIENGVMTIPGGTGFAYNPANKAVSEKTFKNTIFTFKMKLEKMDPQTTPAINNSICFRAKNVGLLWSSGNLGYLWWMKADKNEAQYFSPNIIREFTNGLITFDKEYEISVGVYDTSGGAVKFVLYIDGELIYETIYEGPDNLYGEFGYFMMGSAAGINMIITEADPADYTALNKAIADAEAVRATAVQGDAYGEYSRQAIDAFDAAIAKAKEVANNANVIQKAVDDMVKTIELAVGSFKEKAVSTENVNQNGSATINYDLPQAQFTVSSPVTSYVLNMDPTKKQPAYSFTYQGTNGGVTVEIPYESTLSASGWDGTFDHPIAGTTPSGTIATGQNFMAVTMGELGKVIASSEIVKIVLPGQKDKWLAYQSADGKYTTIKKADNLPTNTLDAAKTALASKDVVKVNEGNDMVIYTKILTEFVAYDFKSNDNTPTPTGTPPTPTYTPGPYQPIGSGSTGSIGKPTPAPTPATGKFADIVGHWAESDINEMVDKGIVAGATKTTFEPDRSITRAEFAALVARALKILSDGTEHVFEDVNSASWYAKDVSAAAKAGLIVGNAGHFRPDDLITREEMAVVMMKAYYHLGHSMQTGNLDQFADKDEISGWAQGYVEQAIGAKLITGMSPNTFAPNENATRAQVASLLKRLLDK